MTSIKQPSFRIEDDEDLVKEQERKGLSQLEWPSRRRRLGGSIAVELPQARRPFTLWEPCIQCLLGFALKQAMPRS